MKYHAHWSPCSACGSAQQAALRAQRARRPDASAPRWCRRAQRRQPRRHRRFDSTSIVASSTASATFPMCEHSELLSDIEAPHAEGALLLDARAAPHVNVALEDEDQQRNQREHQL